MPELHTPFLLEIVVEPRFARDRAALLAALDALAPEIAYVYEAASQQIVVRGHGETELDAAIVGVRDRHGIALRIGAPAVAYRETLTRRIEMDTTLKKHVEGVAAFARLKLVFEPSSDASFATAGSMHAFPAAFVEAVARGIEVARGAGVQGGCPVVDVKVTLVDGAWHETDSSPAAFEMAAITAFHDAQSHAGVLLEPIMRIEVTAPKDRLDAIRGDLSRRRGAIEGMAPRDDRRVVAATVPLANLFGYPAQLRALTRGYGAVTMRFNHFAPVAPPDPPRFPGAVALRIA